MQSKMTEQAATRALQEALAKIMDAEQLCIEADWTGSEVARNLYDAREAVAAAIRATQ